METVSSARFAASAIIPLVILAAMIAFVLWPGNNILNIGVPLPDVTIERIEFHDSLIVAYIRNTGPETVSIAQADINDRILPAAIEPSKTIERLAEARVVIPFDWIAGQPYEVGVTTSDGTRFSRAVAAAAPTPLPDTGQVSLMALIGTYVGVIPVLIGLLWLPFLKRLSNSSYMFFISFTAGLLIFLGIDALVEANEISMENLAGAFKGPMLIAAVTVVSFLVLVYVSERLVSRTKRQLASSFAIATMISIGIGLHNLGEGLAIGSAMLIGEVALSTFLIVGFTIHNSTEGLAIVSPLARERPKAIRVIALGLIAGVPAIIGTWIGGFIPSPLASTVFLSVGAGAVFQVVYAIFKFAGKSSEHLRSGNVIAGVSAGVLVMYLTALLI
jgi:zinc transporter ZupT